ncbi:JAB domain-containing protein [Turicibacter bilis]|uniref:JAB domain-containing protein n=1 Tax=Turicibacter bilis TaxID=2735723 RepID=UPI001F2FF2E9|nr:JAB domain-containing protein [Turicibacter bilis]
MSNVAKRINIVSIKMIKEASFLYQTRTISSPKDAYEMIKEQLEGLDREQFIIACLNTKNEPTNITVVSVGSLNKAIVHPREVFKTAILSNAASIMAFHNHPSGEIMPSQQDIQLTNRLYEAGELLGIKLLDHLIIGDGSPGSEQSEQSSAARVWNIYIIKRKRLFIRS